jgi:hypothetical protein
MDLMYYSLGEIQFYTKGGLLLWLMVLVTYIWGLWKECYGSFKIKKKQADGFALTINQMKKIILWFRVIIIVSCFSTIVLILIEGLNRTILLKMLLLPTIILPFYFTLLLVLKMDEIILLKSIIVQEDKKDENKIE